MHQPRFRPLSWLKGKDLHDAGISRTRTANGRKDGTLKFIKYGNAFRYTREDVERWLGVPLQPVPPRPGSPRVQKLIDEFQTKPDGKSLACGPDA